MSNTVRIRTTPNGGDKYIKLKLDQDFDFVEILSLKISQEEAYRKFCSDYGVVVGRVIVNNGLGVPNAKVSIFIPLDEVDKNDPLISGIYPFELITDKDSNGIRYNLLQKNSSSNNNCFTPVGTFPTKREILDNETLLGVYCKYYKFTTTTNHAGDFMLFGLPIGTHTLHVDADISDIGIISQRPYDLTRDGTPTKFFENATKFKGGNNLDKLVQVKTSNIGVNVEPFWGDIDNCEIGITRADIDLNYNVIPSAIFMGSIYGDQDKNSINKNCTPRKGLGDLCEQITGTGNISMVRKNLDGQIEEFDVDGGRLIDDDGTWAYQVPMNLDYVVTDETGVLIPSDDPNIGIPTKASVRFKIGLDETGGEGRLRTRGSYLVPNNPKVKSEIDYSFGSDTKDTSLKDLYWNKIYTVSNFISRYQRNTSIVSSTARTITGIKNVDGCAGDKTPFPYNRVNTEANPLFFIFCILIQIVSSIVYLMNAVFVPITNLIISAINGVIGIFGVDEISYLGCMTVPCPSDGEPVYFAPGCKAGTEGFNNANPTPNYYCPPSGCELGNANVGLDDCLAFNMAKSLDMYQFDFYNDWVNGSLYSFLLKYKRKIRGREKFCEYDCGDIEFRLEPNYTGADNNENGIPDNDCTNSLLFDTCIDSSNTNNAQLSFKYVNLREGLLKKLDNELIYAATTHDVNNKLFATDIICLGSIFECDWQGIPKIQEFLTPTSYKIPPEIQELADNNVTPINCGMVEIGGSTKGLFFDVNCLGLHTNAVQCLNLRHICEMGVDIDEAVEDQLTGLIIDQADCVIGSNEIDDYGRQLRDIFITLNSGVQSPSSFNLPNGINTDFNIQNSTNYYDFAASYYNGVYVNGVEYARFRGYTSAYSFDQPEHSLFMYFGIIPGKTALDKMNQRYFTTCKPKVKNTMSLSVSATISVNYDGTITLTFIGGFGDITYTIDGPNGYSSNGVLSDSTSITINDLDVGTYVITGVDELGYTVSQTVIVSGPIQLYSVVNVLQNVSSVNSDDGQIIISSIGGGVGPYSYTVTDYNGGLVGTNSAGSNVSTPIIISNLPVETTHGYTVTVTDSLGATSITNGLLITGPTSMAIVVNKTDISCFGGSNGSINLSILGGTPPYAIQTTGPNSYSNTFSNMNGLVAGTYQTNVTDSIGTIASTTNIITDSNPEINGLIITTGPSNGPFIHTVYANGGTGNLTASPFSIGPPHINLSPTITTTITDSLGCTKEITG